MIILEHPLERVLAIIGIQEKKENTRYRLLKYCLVNDEGEEGKTIFNGLTKSAVHLSNSEYENLVDLDYEFLYHSYILVPESLDDSKLAKKYKDYERSCQEVFSRHLKSFTILPTTGCNARCFYCYELGCKTKVMTLGIADKVANYIISCCDRSNPIKFHWFGGEPTINMKAIDQICNRIREAGIQYFSEITSNGYLLNYENAKKARELWNLQNAQITIDGTEKIYNETKNYVYKDDPNPFATLMENIKALLSLDINVNIRLNIDKHNIDNMKELITLLHKKFGNLSNLFIYSMPLFECAKEVKRTDEERKEIFARTSEVNRYLFELGYIRSMWNRNLPKAMCAADDGQSVMILPDGNIGLCEHHTDDEYIATVDKPVYDFEKINEWKEQTPELDICKDCYFWPTCIKLTRCAEQHGCHIYEKQLKLEKEKLVLHNYFKQAKLSDYYRSQIKNKRD